MRDVNQVAKALDLLQGIVTDGGPKPAEYENCLDLFKTIRPLRDAYRDHVEAFHARNANAFRNANTLQGYVVLKPLGYHGDYRIVERIYNFHTTEEPENSRWDEFFHWGSAARAVRGRRRLACDLFLTETRARNHPVRILNVACGPCTDVRDALDLAMPGSLRFTCVDSDAGAIAFAGKRFRGQAAVKLVHGNAFRISSAETYDLVWSAGLFDYLDDRLFVILLKRLGRAVAPGGMLVVGNFGPANTQRSYMEFGFWDLFHRSAEELCGLAERAGYAGDRVSVVSDETGVNLFVKIRC